MYLQYWSHASSCTIHILLSDFLPAILVTPLPIPHKVAFPSTGKQLHYYASSSTGIDIRECINKKLPTPLTAPFQFHSAKSRPIYRPIQFTQFNKYCIDASPRRFAVVFPIFRKSERHLSLAAPQTTQIINFSQFPRDFPFFAAAAATEERDYNSWSRD